MHGNQPINCRSDDDYLLDDLQENTGFELDTKNMSNYENKDDLIPVRKRSVDIEMQNIEKENVLSNNDTMSEFGYARNRVFNINCSDENIMCSKITCNIGPFTVKENVAKIPLKIRLDVMVLSGKLEYIFKPELLRSHEFLFRIIGQERYYCIDN